MLNANGEHLFWLYPREDFKDGAPRIVRCGDFHFVRVSRVPTVLGGDEYKLAEVWEATDRAVRTER